MTMSNEQEFSQVSVTEMPESSSVKITAEIAWPAAEKYRAKAVSFIGKDMKVDGFRPGNIPEKAVVARVGEMAVVHQMADYAIAHMYGKIILAKDIDALGYPKITLTKLAPGNPIEFTAIQQVAPKLELPDYISIARDINAKKDASTEVTEKEVEEQINEILRQKAAFERMQKLSALQGEEHKEEAKKIAESELEIPLLTDETVQSIGAEGQFVDVQDFTAKIREHLTIRKKEESEQKQRAAITDAIIEGTKGVMPEVLIEKELEMLYAEMSQEAERSGISMDDYLKHIKKTKEELLQDWRPNADKRARLQIILNEIAKKESIVPDSEKLETEVNALLARFKDADKGRVTTYVSSVLTNDAVMNMLLAVA